MCEEDSSEDTTEINPECPDDSDPVRIDVPTEPRGAPRPAVDYYRPTRPRQSASSARPDAGRSA